MGTRWKHRWINPNAAPGKSGEHGIGIFSTGHIEKGETVGVLGGVVVRSNEIDGYQKKMGHIGVQISDRFFMCPPDRAEAEKTGAFNHSCEPNAGYSDPVTLVAIRDIKKGEEITFDYAFSETHFEPFGCRCGSEDCRGIVGPEDWKRKEIQKRCGKYFSPFLKRKIKYHS